MSKFIDLLARIAGEEVEVEAETRFEKFLAAIAGAPINIKPENEFEEALAKLAKKNHESVNPNPDATTDPVQPETN